jgi:hypothetical protein
MHTQETREGSELARIGRNFSRFFGNGNSVYYQAKDARTYVAATITSKKSNGACVKLDEKYNTGWLVLNLGQIVWANLDELYFDRNLVDPQSELGRAPANSKL